MDEHYYFFFFLEKQFQRDKSIFIWSLLPPIYSRVSFAPSTVVNTTACTDCIAGGDCRLHLSCWTARRLIRHNIDESRRHSYVVLPPLFFHPFVCVSAVNREHRLSSLRHIRTFCVVVLLTAMRRRKIREPFVTLKKKLAVIVALPCLGHNIRPQCERLFNCSYGVSLRSVTASMQKTVDCIVPHCRRRRWRSQ